MWRDWQRKTCFQLTSYPYTSELHQKLFILLCPFFAFLKKSKPLFQRSRCKDTNFIFGTVQICPFLSKFVHFCPFFLETIFGYLIKNQYLCGVNSITLLYLSNFSTPSNLTTLCGLFNNTPSLPWQPHTFLSRPTMPLSVAFVVGLKATQIFTHT